MFSKNSLTYRVKIPKRYLKLINKRHYQGAPKRRKRQVFLNKIMTQDDSLKILNPLPVFKPGLCGWFNMLSPGLSLN